MRNLDIRFAAKETGVRIWQIAEKLQISDCQMSRKLRKELTDDEKKRIYEIIEKLKAEVE